eukprot:TRINITY_DN121893_c0_g1_i1.p1 TRINITY_DN121893_c0_g1~~TRINITY_DN121893_c0_g1_i1.p1  ORF type:complete len:404 (+),score=90.92 TRINITY_DN121893_c0_g1_i1:78-1289(+)
MWRCVVATPLLLVAFLRVCDGVLLRRGCQRSGRAETGFYAYDYSRHGEDWLMGMCNSKERQSPIDFAQLPATAPAAQVNFGYLPIEETFNLENNGKTYTVEVRAKGYGGVKHNDLWYELMNINVHSISEHTFAGQHLPVELHLVHKRYDGDDLLIVAIPFTSPSAPLTPTEVELPPGAYKPPPETEPGFSPILQSLVMEPLPAPHASTPMPAHVDKPFDLNPLLEGATLFEYYGSMTAPPCSENVIWLVRAEPAVASDLQVQLLQAGVYAANQGMWNYRAAMPLRGRTVRVLSTFREQVVPMDETSSTTTTTVMGVKAGTTTDSALKQAQDAHVYVEDLDRRLFGTTTGVSPTIVEQLRSQIAAATSKVVNQAAGEIAAAVTASAKAAAAAHAAPVRNAVNAK